MVFSASSNSKKITSLTIESIMTVNVEAFFSTWKLYQEIVQQNYMCQREILEELMTYIPVPKSGGVRVLELGCGDATMASKIFSNEEMVSYTGVDLSAPALQLAESTVASAGWSYRLIKGDFSQVVESLDEKYDVILAGFSLHHLSENGKKKIMRNISRLLSPSGSCFVYDVVNREGETRSIYLQRFLSLVDEHWDELTPEQRYSIRNHMEEADFPVSHSVWTKIAMSAGLISSDLLYRDLEDLYGLFSLSLVDENGGD